MGKRKYEKTDKSLVWACVSFLATVALGVLALCFCSKDIAVGGFPLWAIFTISCGACFLAYVGALIYAAALKEFKSILELSVEVSVVAVVLVAVLPLAAVLWVVERIVDAIVDRKKEK